MFRKARNLSILIIKDLAKVIIMIRVMRAAKAATSSAATAALPAFTLVASELIEDFKKLHYSVYCSFYISAN